MNEDFLASAQGDLVKTPVSLKRTFLLVILFFIVIAAVNLSGYFLMIKFHAQEEQIEEIANLVIQQKIAYIRLVSASSNSAIGLAAKNRNLVLEERKNISDQIEKFERLEIEIRSQLEGFKEKHAFENYYRDVDERWQDLKKQETNNLQIGSENLLKSEALSKFIESAKNLNDSIELYESKILATLYQRHGTVNMIARYSYYLNFIFQLLSIPILIFGIFRPSYKRAQELERTRAHNITLSKLSSLGEMAGAMAHEINTPLTVIIWKTQQAVKLLGDEVMDKAKMQTILHTIESTAERIAKIIRGLRLFSRDGSRDTFARVNVSTLIEDTLVFCRDRFKSENINLKVEDNIADVWIEGRVIEISQALLNLLNNSFDAVVGDKDGWVRVSVETANDFVEISVTDSGKGLPAHVRKKLFQPFFTTKEIGKGTGLGLSISLGILKNHGGNLYLDENSANTRFVMQFPKPKITTPAPVP